MSDLPVVGDGIDPVALEQAASWLLLLQEGPLDPVRQSEFEEWRRQNCQNERAWSRAQRLMTRIGRLPAPLARLVLDRPAGSGRRGVMRGMCLLVGGGALGWLSWRYPLGQTRDRFDYSTRPGEQREVTLEDGTQVLLNTASALSVDYSNEVRLLRLLHGEIYVSSGSDLRVPPRPLLVQTRYGVLYALGTRFSVRQFERQALLVVYDGAVQVRVGEAAGVLGGNIIGMGRQVSFDSQRVGIHEPVSETAPAWQIGLLVADEMPLQQWAQELMRYGQQTIVCAPALIDLRVSGVFPVRDIRLAIGMLAQTHELQVRAVGHEVFITR